MQDIYIDFSLVKKKKEISIVEKLKAKRQDIKIPYKDIVILDILDLTLHWYCHYDKHNLSIHLKDAGKVWGRYCWIVVQKCVNHTPYRNIGNF